MSQMCPNPNCSHDNPDVAQACTYCGEPLLGLLGRHTLLEGRYRVIRVLGCGGMGAVYLADDLRIVGRQIAVKESLDITPQAQSQFQAEVGLMVGLDHPGLPKVSDQFTAPTSRQYLVMDYVEGETLEDVVDRRGSLPENEVISLTEQLLDVLEHLHSHSVIHRDVKPANIKLTPGGKPVLVDFGIAKLHAPGHGTRTWARGVGSPGFAPLEQYGTGTDARSDLYSLGAVMYYLLTGQAPPEAPDLMAGTSRLTPPRRLRSSISTNVQSVIFKAMALNPDQRYQSAAEMRQALTSLASVPPGPGALRWPTIGGVIVVALIIVVGVVAYELSGALGSRSGSNPTPTADNTQPPTAVLTQQPDDIAVSESATAEPTPTTPTPSSPAEAPRATLEKTTSPSKAPTAAPPTPSPALDGKIAFYSDRDGNAEIYVMDGDGDNQTRLTNHSASDLFPALSPDGRRIAFVSDRDGNWEIYTMSTKGGDVIRLTYDPGEDRLPVWSPDGTKIVFNSDRAGDLDLYVFEDDGSSLLKLTSDPTREGHATWSPDGRRIAFNSGPQQDEWEIYTIPASGGDRLRLTDNSVIDWAPSWSPDGSHILFLSKRPDNADIYVMDTDGGNQRRVFGGPGYDWGAVWSLDGQYIAFTSDQDEENNIYIMRADGSDVQQLTYDGGAYPSWSR